MTTDRKANGYLWGRGNLDYVHDWYYDLAMSARDIRTEEKFYQQVFHSSSHSQNLTMEIFQKKTRNRVTSLLDSTSIVATFDPTIVGHVKSDERKQGIAYSKVADETKTNDHRVHLQDQSVGLLYMIKDILKVLTVNEAKILAYHISCHKLDQYLVEFPSFQVECADLYGYIEEIWRDDIVDINRLNKFIGTKYAAENARRDLLEKIKQKYPNFLKR